jgi:hypothetical protein
MRHTHTYSYSELRIGEQIPGQILDEVMIRSFQIHEMAMNQGDGVKKEDTGRDGKVFFTGDNIF